MDISIRMDIRLSFDDMTKKVEDYAFPAFLLDKDRIVCVKNERACINKLQLRKGTKIDKYVTPACVNAISCLKIGEMTHIEINLPSFFGAVVFCAKDYYLLTCNAITSTLRKRSGDIFARMSGYDRILLMSLQNAQITPTFMDTVRAKYGRIVRFQTHMSELVKILSGTKTDVRHPFNISSLFESVFSIARDMLPPVKFTAAPGNTPPSLYIEGDEKDFILLFTAMISLSAAYGCKDRLSAGITEKDNEIRLEIAFDSVLESDIKQRIISNRPTDDDFAGCYGELMLDLYLIRLIADCNLWYFGVSEQAGIYDRLVFCLEMPKYTGRVPFELHDAQGLDIKAALELELSLLHDE